jgi:hypothetical protein
MVVWKRSGMRRRCYIWHENGSREFWEFGISHNAQYISCSNRTNRIGLITRHVDEGIEFNHETFISFVSYLTEFLALSIYIV